MKRPAETSISMLLLYISGIVVIGEEKKLAQQIRKK